MIHLFSDLRQKILMIQELIPNHSKASYIIYDIIYIKMKFFMWSVELMRIILGGNFLKKL